MTILKMVEVVMVRQREIRRVDRGGCVLRDERQKAASEHQGGMDRSVLFQTPTCSGIDAQEEQVSVESYREETRR